MLDFHHGLLAEKVMAAVFPGQHLRLEASIQLFQRVFFEFAEHYMRNEGTVDGWSEFVFPRRFHKTLHTWDEERYAELLAKWGWWEDRTKDWIEILTKCANWLVEETQNSVDPSFYSEGRFLFASLHLGGLKSQTIRLEFSVAEKEQFLRVVQKGNVPRQVAKLMQPYQHISEDISPT